jgi:golgi-specific brefeldin A-resistance guanine nucleotide exchange factor 1
LLHTLSTFDEDLLKHCAGPLLKGLSDCCKGSSDLRMELATSPDFWSILNKLRRIPEVAGEVFQLVEDLTTSSQPGITADNFQLAIALLNEVASAAQIGAAQEQQFDKAEQQYDQAKKRGKASKPKKPE